MSETLDPQAIGDELLQFAEQELKTALGELWDENKQEVAEWAEVVARLQLLRLRGSSTIEMTEKYVAAGQKCLLRKLRGRVEDEVYEYAEKVLDFVLAKAALVASQVIKGMLA